MLGTNNVVDVIVVMLLNTFQRCRVNWRVNDHVYQGEWWGWGGGGKLL